MRAVGIIGGIGTESTIEYYRLIISLYRERRKDGNNPPIIINSINIKRMLDLIGANEIQEVTNYLGEEIEKLAKAGADFGILAANTPHIIFEKLESVALQRLIEDAKDFEVFLAYAAIWNKLTTNFA